MEYRAHKYWLSGSDHVLRLVSKQKKNNPAAREARVLNVSLPYFANNNLAPAVRRVDSVIHNRGLEKPNLRF